MLASVLAMPLKFEWDNPFLTSTMLCLIHCNPYFTVFIFLIFWSEVDFRVLFNWIEIRKRQGQNSDQVKLTHRERENRAFVFFDLCEVAEASSTACKKRKKKFQIHTVIYEINGGGNREEESLKGDQVKSHF